MTLPDIDTGQQGTCTVYCVSLNVDKNHDGYMDLTFNGTDSTSAANPDQVWVNDNYDRWNQVDCILGFFDCDSEQDDQGPDQTSRLQPDCTYTNSDGQPAIPCNRDLEDYFRLWTPGLAAAMNAMPADYTVQLKLTGTGGIRIFQAIEPDGGTNYLFDETTASNQVAAAPYFYLGVLTPSSPITLNIVTNFDEHFIFCGATNGDAQIDLQILNQNSNVVADTTLYLQINEIKQMYERWTV